MSIPTDRGYVIFSKDDSGRQVVSISSLPPQAGHSTTVFAEYVGPINVKIDRRVEMKQGAGRSWTTMPVQVFTADGGGVRIEPLTPSAQLAR